MYGALVVKEGLWSRAVRCAVAIASVVELVVALVRTAHSLGRFVPSVPRHLALQWALPPVLSRAAIGCRNSGSVSTCDGFG